MIQIVTGKLGAGKTLYTVIMMYVVLCQGATVVTNIAVDWEEMCKLALRQKRIHLDPAQLVKINPESDRNWQEKIPFGVDGAFVEVFLDEIHLFFNARDWAKTNTESKGLLSFLTQSRKARVNVTFIAQEITTIEKQFRVLAEWELYIVSSAHIPLGPLGTLPFKFFICSQRDAQNGILIKKSCKRYRKEFFRLYGSFTFLDTEMQSLSEKAVYVQRFKLPKMGYVGWLFLPVTRYFSGMFRKAAGGEA
ncbi:MAG: zonular occludens toxin domain-containing protein [Luteolibacter sp.]